MEGGVELVYLGVEGRGNMLILDSREKEKKEQGETLSEFSTGAKISGAVGPRMRKREKGP